MGARPAFSPSFASLVRSRPITAFLVLTVLLSWWPWPLYALGRFPLPVASFGPFLAALIVLAYTHGKTGILALLRSMVRWRVKPLWWLLAVGVPVALSLIGALINLGLGAASPAPAQLANWTSIPLSFLMALLIPGFGGAWEEPGWRGYALPRLIAQRGWVRASLLLGVVGALWHLPMILSGLDSAWELVLLMGANVVLARLYLASGGSVLLMMVLHATNNAFSGSYVTPMFTGADAARQAGLVAVLWAGLAAAILILESRRSQQASTQTASAHYSNR
jgi:membrane protease YdiL (CAAX protease family)